MKITFQNDEIEFDLNSFDAEIYTKWINSVAKFHKKRVSKINYIFTSDEKLYQINIQYLNHDFYTDIITFDYSKASMIAGDLFISLDRINENAKDMSIDFIHEFNRVLIHGVLHLIGYHDKTKEEGEQMRRLEDQALLLLKRLKNGN